MTKILNSKIKKCLKINIKRSLKNFKLDIKVDIKAGSGFFHR